MSCALLLLFTSCKKDADIFKMNEETRKWAGKTILFSEENNAKDAFPYTIFFYGELEGDCSLYRLRLSLLESYMKELDSLANGQVELKLYLYPKDEQNITNLLEQTTFNYPIHIDKDGEMQKRHPMIFTSRCFLLDANNEIILVGNPMHHHKIWEEYKRKITGESNQSSTIVLFGLLLSFFLVGLVIWNRGW